MGGHPLAWSVFRGRHAALAVRSSAPRVRNAETAATARMAGHTVARDAPFTVDPNIALSAKTSAELARAVSLLYVCSVPVIVRNAKTLFDTSNKLLGTTLTSGLLRHTFAAQYTGGETLDDLTPLISRLNGRGIGAILDYVAEADVGDASASVTDANAKEAEHHANMEICKTAIRTAAVQVDKGVTPFAAIKITALLQPVALLSVSRVVGLLLGAFPAAATPSHPTQNNLETKFTRIHCTALADALRQQFPGIAANKNILDRVIMAADADNDQLVDYVDWYTACTTLWEDEDIITAFGWNAVPAADVLEVKTAFALANELGELACKLGVRMMVDAEQTYFQKGIDILVMRLQSTHNTDAPVVYNTIQCYLKDARLRLHIELEAHRRKHVKSGFKFVRGAYIVQERQRAVDLHYPDPICDDIESTHANYNSCVRDALGQLSRGTELMVATHNEKSIANAVNYALENGIKLNGGMRFGQLLGMGDHLTNTLASRGCQAYKYVPYGPVNESVAYLIRRVQENSTMLAGEPIVKERGMLRNELFKRVWKVTSR